MFRAGLFALCTAMLLLAGGLVGQDKKNEDKKNEDPKKVDKKEDPPVKVKGMLPANWKKLGLTDDQVQKVYKIQSKYDAEIDKLQTKIDQLKADRAKDSKAVLTTEQKKRLDEILTGKDK